MSESRRKEFGGKGCRVWAEVIKSDDGHIITAFGSEGETSAEGDKRSQDSVFKDADSLVRSLKKQIDAAHAWTRVNAEEMVRQGSAGE